MLFRKKLPRECGYCLHGTKLNDTEMLCIKKGIVSCDKKCRKFQYDPYKRIPPKPKAINFGDYKAEDFQL